MLHSCYPMGQDETRRSGVWVTARVQVTKRGVGITGEVGEGAAPCSWSVLRENEDGTFALVTQTGTPGKLLDAPLTGEGRYKLRATDAFGTTEESQILTVDRGFFVGVEVAIQQEVARRKRDAQAQAQAAADARAEEQRRTTDRWQMAVTGIVLAVLIGFIVWIVAKMP